MSNPDDYSWKVPFHVNALTVTGFLAGIGFAILVLLIEFSDKYPYFEPLLIGTAFTTVCFILASFGRIHLAGGLQVGPRYSRFVGHLTELGLYGLMALIVFILLPFSLIGAIAIGFIEIVFFITLIRFYRRNTTTATQH